MRYANPLCYEIIQHAAPGHCVDAACSFGKSAERTPPLNVRQAVIAEQGIPLVDLQGGWASSLNRSVRLGRSAMRRGADLMAA
jgi:hypothetical protein